MSLVPSLLQAIVRVDGDALVMHAGDKPYVVSPTGQIDLASRGLSLDAVDGIVGQLLPVESRDALEEFGAVQYELPPLPEFPGEHFTVVAARGGDDMWVEVRRHRVPDDDLIPPEMLPPQHPDIAQAPHPVPIASDEFADVETMTTTPAVSDEDLRVPEAAQLFPREAEAEEEQPAAVAPVEEPAVYELPPLVATPVEQPEPVAVAALPPPPIEQPEPVAVAPPPPPIEQPEPVAVAPPAPPVEQPEPVAVAPPPPPPIERPEPVAVAAPPPPPVEQPEPVAVAPPPPPPPPPAPVEQPEPVAVAPPPPPPPPLAPVEQPEPVAVAPPPPPPPVERPEPIAVASPPPPPVEQPEPVAVAAPPAPPPPLAPVEQPEPVAVAPPPPPIEQPEPVAVAPPPPPPVERPEPVAVVPPPPAPVEQPQPVAVAPPPPAPVEQPQPVAVAPPPPPLPPPVPVEQPEPVAVAPPPPPRRQPTPPKPMAPPEPAVVLPMTRNPIRPEQAGASVGDPTMDGLQRLLRIAAARGASSLYLSSAARPAVRVDGEMQTLESEPVLSARDIESLLLTLMPDRSHEALRTGAPTEWMCDIDDVGRVRCTTFRDHVGPGGVFRLMPTRTVSLEQLGLPRAVQALAIEPEGLVLVAGARSSGKRTLIAAFVDLINRSRRDHVITIEREINFVHPAGSSFISQREVRGNDEELLTAARAALREDPDVLVIEDLRTGALMNVALEAAASGRLVVGGFSAHTATEAIDRIIDLYAPEHRRQVQLAIADTLRGVVAQVLLRKVGGGRTAAREVLLNTPAVSAVIADGKTSQLPMAIEGGRRHGMMPLSDTLVSLVHTGVVDAREAYRRASDRAGLLAALKRQGVDTSFVERLA